MGDGRYVGNQKPGDKAAMKDKVIVFTRFPEVGKVKTRLAAGIGPEEACKIHDRLARNAVRQAGIWAEGGGSTEIRITGAGPARWVEWLGAANWREQGGGDLGERMCRAFKEAFAAGAKKVVVTGTDCPALDSEVLDDAFAALDVNDVVFGPAADGGYYLIGLTQLVPELFKGIIWGESDVLKDSIEKVDCAGLLRTLSDVDHPADLKHGLVELELRERLQG